MPNLRWRKHMNLILLPTSTALESKLLNITATSNLVDPDPRAGRMLLILAPLCGSADIPLNRVGSADVWIQVIVYAFRVCYFLAPCSRY